MLDSRKKFIKTAHGSLRLPFFMPDATRGALKACGSRDLKQARVEAMVVNTLHLYLQPGMKIIKKANGLHNFMNWTWPLLSDSGGYQVFSLIHKNPKMGKISDKGAVFKSPLDGSQQVLTPEKSIQIQFDLGVDMMVCLDDCPPNDYDDKKMSEAVSITINWARRCRREYDRQIRKRNYESKNRPLLFAVIQGGANLDLRKKCADELINYNFDGYGFGARPVDTEGKFLGEALNYTARLIPDDKLKFALGVGIPEDIVRCARMGWDMFDCTIPTREGRHGRLFLRKRNSKFQIPNSKQIQISKFQIQKFYTTININNARFAGDFSAINGNSKVSELREYSKAYLHHLFKIKEPLGQRLASLNNLEFYADLMKAIRNSA